MEAFLAFDERALRPEDDGFNPLCFSNYKSTTSLQRELNRFAPRGDRNARGRYRDRRSSGDSIRAIVILGTVRIFKDLRTIPREVFGGM